jgi:branched-chain amino acid aminotransferase
MNDISEIANINGVITPVDRACIPANDHGFLYGDSVYETIRTYGRRPFLMERHLKRLEESAAAIRLRLPWARNHIIAQTGRTVAASCFGELAVRIIATRGTGPLGYDPDLCAHPNLVILGRPLRPLTRQEHDVGVSAAFASIRRNPIESLDPRIKSGNLLNNILAAHQAKEAGVAEALLLNTAGFLAEGTNTNVFLVKDGRLMTPSLDCGILSGVTREMVLDVASSEGIPCEQGRYRAETILGADEIFLTSTTREILPVASLEGKPVGAGRRGPLTTRLQELFRVRVEEILAAQEPEGKPD